MARTWQSVLGRIGTPTGDKRIIAPGALTHRDLPLPLMWQRVSGEGHGGAVTVGVIEQMTIDDATGMVTGSGRMLEVRGSADAERQMDAGVTGPSMDLFDDLDVEEVQTLIENGVVGPDLIGNMDEVTYAVDGDGVVIITSARIAGATLVQIPAFADVSITLDPEPTTEPLDMDWMYASAAPELPPLEYFTRPETVGPVTVDGDRVYGYMATWGTCHIGLPGCTTAPSSHTSYAHFLRQEQQCADGTAVPVGVLSVGGGHASPDAGVVPALEHYDNVGSAVARVFAGEDEHGIWVSGWVPPYADPDKLAMLADLDVSGDWRRIGGNLELIAVCAVNTPGFPVLKKVSFSLGKGGQQTLIGQFKVEPEALLASVRSTGWSSLPLADESRAWDGDAAAGRIASWAGLDAEDAPASAWSKYARGFLRKDDDADPQTRGAYGFPIADVIDGTLTIVPRGVFAAAAAVQGARSGSEPAEADAMRRVLSGIYRRLDRTPPWDDSMQESGDNGGSARAAWARSEWRGRL